MGHGGGPEREDSIARADMHGGRSGLQRRTFVQGIFITPQRETAVWPLQLAQAVSRGGLSHERHLSLFPFPRFCLVPADGANVGYHDLPPTLSS
jgi:hypothetical protein